MLNERYAKDILNIPFVNFKDIDPLIINDLLNTLNKAYKKYPLLKNTIVFIYQGSDYNIYENIERCSNKDYWLKWQRDFPYLINYYQEEERIISTMIKLNENKKIVNIGLVISDGFKNIDYKMLQCECIIDCLKGYKAKHCRYFDSIIWHEIGHILDSILHISQKEEFKKLLINVNIKEEISLYATTSYQEILAEAFAEYIKATENNELEEGIIKDIGLLIDKEYLRYSYNQGLKELFNIKRNFPQARRR